jgi:hypothetical protein
MIGGMYIEVLVLAGIIIGVLIVNGKIDKGVFFMNNPEIYSRFKESDYDFYVRAKYGDQVDPDVLFSKRIQNGALVVFLILFISLANLKYTTVIASLIAGYFTFKMQYSSLKKSYKAKLHEYDTMLPYYLKNLEILVQHYTVPVALGKSIDEAPPIFKKGLEELINTINAGDSTIEPYMEFARTYPVRDSMRMMRLLYRLSLGTSEGKQEQLLNFSKTISNLQAKAREIKYKNRLEKMEGKTMIMLTATGFGVMVLLLIAIVNMMSM